MPVLTRNVDQDTRASIAFPRAIATDLDRVPEEEGLSRQKRPLDASRLGLFTTCANPNCNSGWLRLWRGRSTPIFESGWCCSPACTTAQVQSALRRELEMQGNAEQTHRHRIPLGLTMLEQGWITKDQLRAALEAQKAAGGGRIGQWLVRLHGVSEQLVTRALSLQWSCPVLGLEFHDVEVMAALLPRLFVDAFDALPLRVAAGKILYLGFEDCLDPVLALAVERMTGLHVESGLVQDSVFRPAHARMLRTKFPPVELIEACTEAVLAQVLARRIERAKPVEARLVRMHDCLWLRLWMRPQRGPVPELSMIQDLICSLRAS